MIYLADKDQRIAAAECEATAARLEQQGYMRVSRRVYRALWQRKDRKAMQEMAAA